MLVSEVTLKRDAAAGDNLAEHLPSGEAVFVVGTSLRVAGASGKVIAPAAIKKGATVVINMDALQVIEIK